MEIKDIFTKLAEKNLTFGSIESMTGGLFASTITSVSGASKVYKGTVVTYTAETKTNVVGVKEETINKHTVVSSEVAQEMAFQGQKLLNVDICISVTGNAGPTLEKDTSIVGQTFFGVCYHGVTAVMEFVLKGERNEIQKEAVQKMIEILATFVK